jgi:heme-degrading monooxygenase HmoA
VGTPEPDVTVLSVLRLPVRPEAKASFADRFAQLRVFERSRESGGFLGGRLLRPVAEGGPFLVVADWESANAYQTWLDNPVRSELAAELEPLLLDEVIAGELFEEI